MTYTSTVLPLISLNVTLLALTSHYPNLLSTPAFTVFHVWFLFSSIVAFQQYSLRVTGWLKVR
ncbi:hypothetical protein BZA05DRAFT_446882 [Tricharina praecox]|uniref:uncharacterized protein n=1 Tax=Tricharina praecox TaxID=43433 RepID=UPI00221FDC04|nr:uncharacterized protein BZA05DRAFT_446882 [Tricharina praecox]KAI5848177.1 hypothetical protein BZA05DRAFT_446882 [Tricharina praecox]